MNLRKKFLALLAISILGISNEIGAINQPLDEQPMLQNEVPLLSPKQLSKQMQDLRRYLNRVRRCMFTGPCTKEEIVQVQRHIGKVLKGMGIIGAGALLYRGFPRLKAEAEAQARRLRVAAEAEAEQLGKAAAKGAAGEIREAAPVIARSAVEAAAEAASKHELGTKFQFGGPGGVIPIGAETFIRPREEPRGGAEEAGELSKRRGFLGEPLSED
jgi:hypothetical protein